jgi:MoxR-like ATPase
MNSVKDIMKQAMALADGKFVSQPLPQQGSWPQTTHLLDKHCLLAIAAALGAQRPLLVRGEPGTGKSHFARAAAELLDRHFISTVVQPQTEYQELLWTFDFTQRLADAQLMSLGLELFQQQCGATADSPESDMTATELLAPSGYTSPGPLWYAYDWSDAQQQCCQTGYQPEPTNDKQAPESLVLLIDEIDKADVSLCNGLLEVLGNRSFRVPHRALPVGGQTDNEIPLVILTSNSVRELPRAFLRRCVLLDITLPESDALEAHLQTIGGAHFPEMDNSVLTSAAQQIRQDRDSQSTHTLKTGVAEYVDLLRALQNTAPTATEQLQQIEALAAFFFKHQPNE